MNTAPIEQAALIIRQGGIVAYATEYCFGLGCDPCNPRALKRLLRFKQRSWTKGLIVLAANTAQLADFVETIPDSTDQHWPGPVTCLLPARSGVLHLLRGRSGKIAVRVTAHAQAARLCLASGSAIVSTSANRAGEHPVLTYHEAVRRISGLCDYILPGRTGGARQASTIIDPVSGQQFR